MRDVRIAFLRRWSTKCMNALRVDAAATAAAGAHVAAAGFIDEEGGDEGPQMEDRRLEDEVRRMEDRRL